MTSEKFSSILQDATTKYMNCGLTLRYWRHIAIAIQREFVPHISSSHHHADTLANHSTAQARRTYAAEEGQLPEHTTDAMIDSRRECEAWHNVLGWGELPPPPPMRLSHYNSAHAMVDQAALTTVVTNVVKSSLDELSGGVNTLLASFKNMGLASPTSGTPNEGGALNVIVTEPPPPALHNPNSQIVTTNTSAGSSSPSLLSPLSRSPKRGSLQVDDESDSGQSSEHSLPRKCQKKRKGFPHIDSESDG